MSSSIEDLLQIEKIQQYYQSFQVSRRDIQPKSYHTDSGTSSTLSNAMGLPLLGTCSSPLYSISLNKVIHQNHLSLNVLPPVVRALKLAYSDAITDLRRSSIPFTKSFTATVRLPVSSVLL